MKCNITKLICRTLCLIVALMLAACGGGVGSSGSKSPGDTPPPVASVTIDQRTPVVGIANQMTFTASTSGLSNPAVTWSVAEGATGGSIGAATGLYVAPSHTGTFTIVARSVSNPSVSDSVSVSVSAVVPPPPPPANPPVVRIGGHLPEISTWTAPIYADFLKQGAPWSVVGAQTALTGSQLDANGWPTVDCRIGFSVGSVGPSSVIVGTHKLRFNGQATITIRDAGSIQNQAYDAATNATTADVVITAAGPNYLLEFTNAWRKADHTADATGSTRGITNVRLIAAGHAWPQDYWRKEIASLRNVYSVMQFEWPQGPGDGTYSANAGLTGVMGSGETTWATRSRPNFLGYTAKGMPWEDIVIFANQMGIDPWVHIPIGADDDYIRKAFQLLRYGSDGNLPYTTTTHDPATWTQEAAWYPGLLPGRKVYVEFTNELFSYYQYGDPRGAADIAAGDPHHLSWDGATNAPGDRWGAWNIVRISLLARQVWGDAAMQDTIRMSYANQGDWGSWARHRRGLEYIDAVWGPNSPYNTIGPFTNPRQPVSYYLHNVSGSFYLHSYNSNLVPTATTVDQLLTEVNTSLSVDGGLGNGNGVWESNSVYQRHAYGEALAAQYGIKFTSYETGIEIFNYGTVGAAWADPRMKTVYYNLLKHMLAQPHADVAIQSATVRGARPPNELSRSYLAADGFPWPLTGTAAPTQMWQAVIDVAGGK